MSELLAVSSAAWPLGASALLGQTPAAGSATVTSVWDLLVKGGPLMVPIIVASLISLAVFVERSIVLRRRSVIPPNFVASLVDSLRATGGSTQSALDLCRRSSSPIAEILASAIRCLDMPIDHIERRVIECGRREVRRLRRGLRSLSVIASVATLLGLLGTIVGMIRAFQTVAASGEALGRTELLAQGIYEALITTGAGLVVAIPAILAYHWLAARAESLTSEFDRIATEFIDEFAGGRARASSAPGRNGDAKRGAAPPAAEPDIELAPAEA